MYYNFFVLKYNIKVKLYRNSRLLFCFHVRKSGDAHIKTAYIDLLVVDEKHRRKGIEKALFNEVQKRTRKVGAKRVNLTVWSYNKIAESAYESYGMTPLRSVYEIGIY